MNTYQIVTLTLGLAAFIGGFAFIISKKHYLYLSRAFFIEKYSGKEKEVIRQKIKFDSQSDKSRIIVSLILIGLGVQGIGWSLFAVDLINILFPLFFSLLILALLLNKHSKY